MAQIKYLDSRRIMGASGDTVEESTFEDDFSSDNWTDYGSDFGVSGGTMAWNKTANSGSWINLGSSLSDEKWVCRFTLNILNASSFNNEQPIFMIGSVSGSVTDATTMDYIGFQLQTYSNDYYIWCGNGATLASPTFNTNLSKTITTGTVYVELRRTSATEVILSIYSDSGFSSLSATKTLTISSGITGLQYFRLHSRLAGTGTINGTIDNLEIYNGLSSVTGKPKQALSLSGCKAYYNFEQTSGSLTNIATTANGFDDGLGSSADGTNNGATTGSTGKVGSYAWDFDGTNDYVQLTSSTSNWNFLHNGSNHSYSYWIKLGNTGGSAEYFLFDVSSSGDIGIAMTVNTSDQIQYSIYRGASGTWVVSGASSTSLDTNWHHVAITYDGSNARIYIDGSLDSTIAKTANAPSSSNSTYSLKIGATGDVTGFADVSLDELAIFNRVLTADEISTLYNSGTGVAVNDSSLKTKIETNSIFVETDTASRWWFDGNNWNMQPTFQDDFSTDSWTHVGVQSVTNNQLKLLSTLNATNNTSSKSLGTTLNGNFVLRFEATPSYSGWSSGGSSKMTWFGLVDSVGESNTSHDWVLFGFEAWSSANLKIGGFVFNSSSIDHTNSYLGFPSSGGSIIDFVSGTTYYCEIIKNGNDHIFNIYSDSSYSTILGSVTKTVANVSWFLNIIGLDSKNSVSNYATYSNLIDNVKFYNGVTSVQQ